MGFGKWLVGLVKGGAKEVADGAGSLAIDIRQAIKGKEVDPDKLIELEDKRLGLQEKTIALNALDAKSNSKFNSGWRPFMGWVCGVSIGTYFIPQFAMASYLWVRLCLLKNELVAYPKLDAQDHLFELVLAMLGLGIFRTYEKKQKVNNK